MSPFFIAAMRCYLKAYAAAYIAFWALYIQLHTLRSEFE
jgi:hypothetical protein